MFDWPEPTQTSPTRTSFNSILFLPLTVRVWGLPSAFLAGSVTFQLPLPSALVLTLLSPNWTTTSSLGSAHPQIGSGLSRCRTMWSPTTLGSRTSARAEATDRTHSEQAMRPDTMSRRMKHLS